MGRGKTRKQKKINILKKKRKYLCPRKPKEGREPSNNDSVIVLEETTPSPEADQERLQQRSSRSIKKFVSPLELSKSVRQMIKIKKRKREKKRKEKNKFVRLLFKNENSPLELWQKVCIHYNIPEDVANSWLGRIKQRLSQTEPARAYHNWNEMIMRKREHLQDCNPNIILAVLFQYYVYEGNRNCAKENCAAFEEFCCDAQIDDVATKNLVLKLLDNRTTEMGELTDSYEQDANLLQDLDLVILAAPLDDYKAYTNLLRQEYSTMSDENYNRMRLKVLETLLIIPNIFSTPEFQTKFEETARNNIKWEISKLKLSPTSRRPILGLNTIDEFNFKLFRHKLRTHDCQLNSTTLSDLNTPRKQNILTDNVPNVLETIEHLGGTCNKNLPVKIQQSVRENTLKSKHNETTREEGEITQTTIASNDDDCICIEEEIEEIIIDDTEDNGIFFKDTSKMQFIDLTPKRTSLNQSKPIPSPASNGNDNDNEVIVIDESFVAANRKSSKTPKKTMDESVVFISETQPDYIPLVSNNTRKSFKILPESTPKKQIHRDSLFSKSEKKELASYNANAYNPNAIKELEERRQNPKRMVIIDGSNVAYAHSRKQTFSVKGLQICIEYFKKMGHEVKAVIPLYRLHKSTDPNALELLHREGVIVLTPCKNLPGLSSSSYDDRFILQLASELDAAIVSNDNYRDLINENSAFKKLIENRVIGYTWCDDVFIIPKDPYGKFGPTLHSILNRQIEDSKS